MGAKWAAGLLLLVVLAGCSESAEPQADANETSFDDVDVTVSEDTGAIRGVVINDAIVPVEGARVVIQGQDLETTSDAAGRFAFSDLTPGTYFLEITKELHDGTQTGVDVVAGVAQPDILKVRLNRLYTGDPYVVTIPNDGFFTCSQAGTIVWGYTSSPCHSIGWGTNVDTCDQASACLEQKRVFHVNVDAGWQTLIYEMTWEASAQGTSDRMGMSVSTYHPERNKNHWFASFSAHDPMYFTINTGEMHPTAQEGSGPMGPVPADGIVDMSMYMSVREPDPCTGIVYCPGFAIDQDFSTWHTQFYYQPAPDGWSFMAGDQNPF